MSIQVIDFHTMHAEIQIGDSIVMLGGEGMGEKSAETLGGTSGGLMIYVEDVDATFAAATGSGAKMKKPVADMFWGDRFCEIEDPFGHNKIAFQDFRERGAGADEEGASPDLDAFKLVDAGDVHDP